ncbi:transposase [Streptomyces sp. NPDC020800]|uniref:transposase n=1 Tax=Streptomyces sp. NPDC020800 TaxID=3365092 RepID=UPI0037AC1A61
MRRQPCRADFREDPASWGILNVHRSAALRQWAAGQDWLTIIQLPTHAPDLNPVEGIWSLLRRSATANRVFANREDLVRAIRSGMRRIQRHAPPHRRLPYRHRPTTTNPTDNPMKR